MLPLDGCNVLELAQWRPGPYAGQLLAELGADVVKVEPPAGDPMRSYPHLFAEVAAGKRSRVLDLKAAADREACLELAASAHIVLEGYRPGVAARLGIGPDDVRAVQPGVTYVSVSGFGAAGPLAGAPGHDVNYMGWSGALWRRDGGGVAEPALPVADLSAGMAAALAAVSGWVRWLRTGEGTVVDLAMTDVLAQWAGRPGVNVPAGFAVEQARLCAYGVFAAADGWLTLGVTTEDGFWGALCAVLDLPPELAALGFDERLRRTAELRPAIEAALASRRRDDVVAALLAADVPCGPVLDHAGMAASEHLRGRGTVVDGPDGGAAFGPLLRFAGARTGPPPPAPALDEHRGQTFRSPLRP